MGKVGGSVAASVGVLSEGVNVAMGEGVAGLVGMSVGIDGRAVGDGVVVGMPPKGGDGGGALGDAVGEGGTPVKIGEAVGASVGLAAQPLSPMPKHSTNTQ
jgi:hypothetical protein